MRPVGDACIFTARRASAVQEEARGALVTPPWSRTFSSVLPALGDARPIDLALQLQGSTGTPLRGAKGATAAPPDDRRTRGRKVRRPSANPCDARPRGAPPSPSYTEKPDGGGKVPGSRERGRGRGRDDSECLLATPTTPALVRDTRRASELRMGCARHVCSVVVLASRPRAASNGHRSGGHLMYRRRTRRSTRALTKCCVARSGRSRRRSRPCSR